jgi:hypothetical protein
MGLFIFQRIWRSFGSAFLLWFILISFAQYFVTSPDYVSLSASVLDDLFLFVHHKDSRILFQTIRLGRITI